MSVSSILAKIIESNGQHSLETILDLVLPSKADGTYSLECIDDTLLQFQEEIEALQRASNDKFDQVLVEPVRKRLGNMVEDITKTLSNVNHLQEDINHARRQFETVKDSCSKDTVVQNRQEMLSKELELKRDLQRSKFSSVLEFFKHFCDYLTTSLATCKKLSSTFSENYLQCFDWANYHQVLFLLRACGQAIDDIDKFERLFHSCKDMFGLSFRQPIIKMDFNNFIEFHSSYSLKTQVDVILNSHGDRCELGKYLEEPKVAQLMSNYTQQPEDSLFNDHLNRVVAITIDCCQLLVDLNLNYIEAYLTDGINIDKLNGYDAVQHIAESPPVEVLPSYAFSPQDYITQIGQHLLALKKQTERFDQADDGPLMRALSYLKHVRNCATDGVGCKTTTETVLKCVARQIIRSLVGRTTASVFGRLNVNGRKQIATDALYLDDVLKDLNLLDKSDPFVERFKSLFEKTNLVDK